MDLKLNNKDIKFEQLSVRLERAENRLSRNLNNSLWGFTTFVGFHAGFIYASKEALATGFQHRVIGLIIVFVGTILSLASIMSMNTYRFKIRANESVIGKIEEELGDYQQKVETEWKKPYIRGAGNARELVFVTLWILEIALGIAVFLASF